MRAGYRLQRLWHSLWLPATPTTESSTNTAFATNTAATFTSIDAADHLLRHHRPLRQSLAVLGGKVPEYICAISGIGNPPMPGRLCCIRPTLLGAIKLHGGVQRLLQQVHGYGVRVLHRLHNRHALFYHVRLRSFRPTTNATTLAAALAAATLAAARAAAGPAAAAHAESPYALAATSHAPAPLRPFPTP